jgi:hypothetical protein
LASSAESLLKSHIKACAKGPEGTELLRQNINLNKENLMSLENEKKYNSYLINHFLSGTIDTLFYANEMNQRPFLDKRLQYDFLRFGIKKSIEDRNGLNQIRLKILK